MLHESFWDPRLKNVISNYTPAFILSFSPPLPSSKHKWKKKEKQKKQKVVPRMWCCGSWVSPLTLVSLLSCSPLIDIYLTSINLTLPLTLSPSSLLTLACSNQVRKAKIHKRKSSRRSKRILPLIPVVLHWDSIHPVPRGTMLLLLHSYWVC